MTKPQFVINKLRRTQGGCLPTSAIQDVRARLIQRGLVLLPSDTCYSLGALAIGESDAVRRQVNDVLGRKDDPISLAFSSYLEVQRYVRMDNTISLLLERFTPGPLTIVCKAKGSIPQKFLSNTIGSIDETIGVRLPDSVIERDIAASTEHPLMTVAVRDPDGNTIQDFGRALEIVARGVARVGAIGWAAVEGGPFYASHSTVVRFVDVGKVELLREGDIPFTEISEAIKTLSGWSVEDWT